MVFKEEENPNMYVYMYVYVLLFLSGTQKLCSLKIKVAVMHAESVITVFAVLIESEKNCFS